MRRDGMTAREAAIGIVRRLREAGHVAYLAGGCVRDALLGFEPKDYDVATDARPEIVRTLFRRSRYVGEAFGVCLVKVGEGRGHQVEVATFRVEWGYTDGRRPEHVEFTDAEHDARRRDFTINGLFEDPLDGSVTDPGEAAEAASPGVTAEAASPGVTAGAASPGLGMGRVIDYVGGVEDLQARVVRAIGDPDERFAEDYLRMLRAARFAARLGFEIEAKTAAAIRPLAKYLGQISRERIGQEVAAMLTPPAHAAPDAPSRAVTLMSALRLDGVVLNEDHRPGKPDQARSVLASIDRDATYPTRLAAWMIDRYVGGGDLDDVAVFIGHEAGRLIERWRSALCLSNTDRDGLRDTLMLVGRAAAWGDLGVAQRKRLLASPRWKEALRLLWAIGAAGGADRLAVLEREAAPLLAEGVAPPPLVGGDDLIAMGLRPGPAFGRLLEAVYDAQLEGRVTTAEEARAWVRGKTEAEDGT